MKPLHHLNIMQSTRGAAVLLLNPPGFRNNKNVACGLCTGGAVQIASQNLKYTCKEKYKSIMFRLFEPHLGEVWQTYVVLPSLYLLVVAVAAESLTLLRIISHVLFCHYRYFRLGVFLCRWRVYCCRTLHARGFINNHKFNHLFFTMSPQK